MKFYFILFLIGWFLRTDRSDVNYVYVDSKTLSTGFEIVDISDGIDISDELVSASDEEFEESVLEVQVGKLSRYGPDCYGCSGYLAYGDYVGDGRIYFTDVDYGDVRILAADRKYPFGTIVRVNTNTESFLAIVLDRGGAIGLGKIALFDLLYSSEYLANLDGVSYNTTFEILRYGF